MEIKVICAWCKCLIQVVNWDCSDKHGDISHGICPDCVKKQQEKIRVWKENNKNVTREIK